MGERLGKQITSRSKNEERKRLLMRRGDGESVGRDAPLKYSLNKIGKGKGARAPTNQSMAKEHPTVMPTTRCSSRCEGKRR